MSWRHSQHWPSSPQDQLAGIGGTIGIVRSAIAADDDQIGCTGFPCNVLRRKIQGRSPLDLTSIRHPQRRELISPFVEHCTHLIELGIRRLRIDDHALHREGRPRHPGRGSDQMRMKAIGQARGEPNPTADFAVRINMHQQGRVRHFLPPRELSNG